MTALRALVIENTANWMEELPRLLKRIGNEMRAMEVDVASNQTDALAYFNLNTYDLAIFDLSVPKDATSKIENADAGLELLSTLRGDAPGSPIGIIVLSAYGTSARMRKALRELGAYDFMSKQDFDAAAFTQAARGAILSARLHHAADKAKNRYQLSVTFGKDSWLGSELFGPDRRIGYQAQQNTARFDRADLARRADNLNLMILRGGSPDVWRFEARSIGTSMYDAIADEKRILADLVTARALAQKLSDVALHFVGPADGLGTPFELMRDDPDGGNYLVLNHIVTRRALTDSGRFYSNKPESFGSFISELAQRKKPLRMLIVGANSDGNIPAAEEEARQIASACEADLKQLGVIPDVQLLAGPDATYSKVVDALQSKHFQVLHYAGHGRFNDKVPAISGLMLDDSGAPRSLSADTLNSLAHDSELRLVYLSCCWGARNEQTLGRGDFHGVLDALVQAGVPVALGYRWTVGDAAANLMAHTFYQSLWRNFSPGEALLRARQTIAEQRGRDDETWASMVMVTQNE